MRPIPFLSPRATGFAAALVTIVIWTSFIVIARASADPSRAAALTPLDLGFARLLGAGTVLLPLGFSLVRRDRARGQSHASMFGFSPLPLRTTATVGFFGGLLYPLVACCGFVYAPAGHAAVLTPGSLPLWTAMLAALFLGTHISRMLWIGLALIVAGDALVGESSLLCPFGGSEGAPP